MHSVGGLSVKCKEIDVKSCKILACIFEENVSKCKGVTFYIAFNLENSQGLWTKESRARYERERKEEKWSRYETERDEKWFK